MVLTNVLTLYYALQGPLSLSSTTLRYHGTPIDMDDLSTICEIVNKGSTNHSQAVEALA